MNMLKRNQCYCLVALFLCLILASCSRTDHNTKNQNACSEHENYDVYQVTDQGSDFNKSISENPIDRDYREKISSNANTTADYSNLETYFVHAWQDEMEYSVKRYMSVLSEQDAKEFEQLQSDWENNLEKQFAFERNVLFEDNNIALGSASSYLFLSNIRQAYRSRTIHIKYLHYLIETQGDTSASADRCDSLEFHYSINRDVSS